MKGSLCIRKAEGLWSGARVAGRSRLSFHAEVLFRGRSAKIFGFCRHALSAFRALPSTEPGRDRLVWVSSLWPLAWAVGSELFEQYSFPPLPHGPTQQSWRSRIGRFVFCAVSSVEPGSSFRGSAKPPMLPPVVWNVRWQSNVAQVSAAGKPAAHTPGTSPAIPGRSSCSPRMSNTFRTSAF